MTSFGVLRVNDPSIEDSQRVGVTAGVAQELERASVVRLCALDIAFGIATLTGFFPIINRISITLKTGEIVGILGPNGCGKSTLLRVLSRLESPTDGAINYPEQPAKIGMVFQDVQQNLVPWQRVIDNVALPAILAKGNPDEARKRAEVVLREMGLDDLAERYPNELSGGQQQLVALGRWVANPPSLLFVDEGWSMLDFVQRERAYQTLRRLAAEQQCALCVVSHNVSELAGVADNALVLTERPARVGAEVALNDSSSPGIRTERLWEAARKIFHTSSAA